MGVHQFTRRSPEGRGDGHGSDGPGRSAARRTRRTYERRLVTFRRRQT